MNDAGSGMRAAIGLRLLFLGMVLTAPGMVQITWAQEAAQEIVQEAPREREPMGPPAETQPTPPPRRGMFTTEVWLTPLILLPGVALLIVSTSARFGQLHTEFHRLVDHPDAHARILSRHLLRRSSLFRDALVALYASVGLFALGSLLGAVVNVWRPESLWVVGGATIAGIVCVVYASAQLIREALICLQVVTDHAGRLQDIILDD